MKIPISSLLRNGISYDSIVLILSGYCPDIVEIMKRYERKYDYIEYSEQYSDRLNQFGTIVYIEQLDHYLVRLTDGWGDSYYTLRGIPTFGYREELSYAPRYIVYLNR